MGEIVVLREESPPGAAALVIEENLRVDGREAAEGVAEEEAATCAREAAHQIVTWVGEKTMPRGCDHSLPPLEAAEVLTLEVLAHRVAVDEEIEEIETTGHPLIEIAVDRGRRGKT
mmetsp:Transcript_24667/g.71131  ORF Transcript_24667/g.71131 Transcript_24667/m.71131 type:complete len:116 (+) Transcript_24667:1943-2290(+)